MYSLFFCFVLIYSSSRCPPVASSLGFRLLEKAALLDNFDNLPKLLASIRSSVGSSTKFRTSDEESNDTVIDLIGKHGIAALHFGRLSLTSLEAPDW